MKEKYIVTIRCRAEVDVNTIEGMTQEEIDRIAIGLALAELDFDSPCYLDADNYIDVEPA